MSFEQDQKDIGTGRNHSSPFHQRRSIVIAALLCLLFAGAYFYFTGGNQKSQGADRKGQAAPPSPVAAVAARTGDFTLYLTGLGTVTPLNIVSVKTRVDGELIKVLFREGQLVNKGDVLAEIDPRPFEVQLTQAEGASARDQALLQNARLDLERYEDLLKRNLIPRQQLDTQVSLVRQYEGAVKADQGQIDNAKLQLAYSRIKAPISGRIGLRQVDPGNIVHATDANGLVVITQLEPIAVIFSLPEDNLAQVLKKLRSGARLTVLAYDRELTNLLATGTLLTVDNQVDPNTGTVKYKATFSNVRNELFPNQFVNARLLVDTKHDALIIPAAAIQRGPQGTSVYVVKPDRTVEARRIVIGLVQEGEASVASGLSGGELVVVEGAERLRDGSRVELKSENTGTQQQRKT